MLHPNPRVPVLALVCAPVIALVLLFWHLDADYRAFLGEVGKHSSPTSDTSSGVTGHSYQVGVWPQSSLSDEQQHSAPQVPAAALVEALQAYLNGRLGLFDDAHHFDEYGLKVGEMDLRAYVRRLEDMHTRFFVSNSSTSTSTSESDYITQVRSRLSLRPPTEAYAPRPAVLSTTDKNPDDLPEMFDEWSLKMPDLEVMAYGDAQLDEWVAQRFGGTGLQDIWNRLPRAVLKSDVFRYLVLLLDGGIYADSDTAPIIPADEWGMPYDVKTPDLIRGLSSLLRTAKPPGEQEEAIIYPVDDGSEHGDPVLVVGVEFDSVMYGWNWREIGVSRAVQITQWVMMSRPGHPVFLDVVGRILEQTLVIEQEEAEAAARGEAYVEPWALEWTGPGIWTDAVYRYLLVRYGFLPEDLIGAQRPIRVGDVLILPSKTFAADMPNEAGTNGKPFDAVSHGFHGRWRADDPALHQGE